MTDIKEPINTTSDCTFLSVVCENPEKGVVGQKLGGHNPPPRNYPHIMGDNQAHASTATPSLTVHNTKYLDPYH